MTAAEQHADAALPREVGESLGDAGLADAGIAADEHDAATPRANVFEASPQALDFVLAADEQSARRRCKRGLTGGGRRRRIGNRPQGVAYGGRARGSLLGRLREQGL